MKLSKWYIFLGGLFYCAPIWVMIIPIVVNNFKASTSINDTSILAIAVIMAFWCLGMDLIRIQHLEEEVEKLNKKLGEKD